jgi:sucrose phosphorylase
MQTEQFKKLLGFLYGEEQVENLFPRFMSVLEEGRPAAKNPGDLTGPAGKAGGQGEEPFTHRDAFLISYGDMLGPGRSGNEQPASGQPGAESGLARLGRFLEKRNPGIFSCLHILPFHPYSSDDGFSVIDYRKVDPRFGSWDDLEKLSKLNGVGKGEKLKLVFDFVINHGSVQSPWFKGFLAGDERYRGWYITKPENYDYRSVVRPRTHPLLTAFTGKRETVYVWTTFSADQADYDFSNPAVLLEFVRIFLEYAKRGAGIVRLDAIAYLWKEDGHPCIHHPKTHGVVKLFRAIIDYLELPLLILTETNVPHEENISYFGKTVGNDAVDSLPEAHMVYNFALPPLVLHAALSGDAAPLRSWARTLPGPEKKQFFLNFLASHDGVGLTPARGLVDEHAFAQTLEEAQRRGALISYKSTPRGAIPYELNCSYASLAAPPSMKVPGGETLSAYRARAFAALHGVLFSLSGLPAVYFHSWIGSQAWEEGPGLLGYNRAINREKPPIDLVETELDDPQSFRFHVYRNLNKLIAFRQETELFGPGIEQRTLDASGSLFVLLRGPDRRGRWALCIENLGDGANEYTVLSSEVPAECKIPEEWKKIQIASWETRWLVIFEGKLEKSLVIR